MGQSNRAGSPCQHLQRAACSPLDELPNADLLGRHDTTVTTQLPPPKWMGPLHLTCNALIMTMTAGTCAGRSRVATIVPRGPQLLVYNRL